MGIQTTRKKKADEETTWEEILERVDYKTTRPCYVEDYVKTVKRFIDNGSTVAFRSVTDFPKKAEKAATLFKSIQYILDPSIKEGRASWKPKLDETFKVLEGFLPTLKKIGFEHLKDSKEEIKPTLRERIPDKNSKKGKDLQRRGFVYRSQINQKDLDVLLDQFKTEPGKDLMRGFYKIEKFPKNIHNLRVTRGLTRAYHAPEWVNQSIENEDGDLWKHDVSLIRKYLNSHR